MGNIITFIGRDICSRHRGALIEPTPGWHATHAEAMFTTHEHGPPLGNTGRAVTFNCVTETGPRLVNVTGVVPVCVTDFLPVVR